LSRRASGALLWSALDVEGAEGARSGDPLGLRVLIRHLGGRISPALTRSSSRVWGFGLLALGVRLAGPRGEAERRFLRWQRLLVLAAAFEARQLDGEVDAGWRVGGIARATRMVEQSTTVRLDRPLLAHERSSGLWGGFARACRMYGIVTHGRLGSGVTCTAPGNRLADATRSALRSHQQEQRLRAIVAGRTTSRSISRSSGCPSLNPGDLPRSSLTGADAGGPQARRRPLRRPLAPAARPDIGAPERGRPRALSNAISDSCSPPARRRRPGGEGRRSPSGKGSEPVHCRPRGPPRLRACTQLRLRGRVRPRRRSPRPGGTASAGGCSASSCTRHGIRGPAGGDQTRRSIGGMTWSQTSGSTPSTSSPAEGVALAAEMTEGPSAR
jgi:hypothetical protein